MSREKSEVDGEEIFVHSTQMQKHCERHMGLLKFHPSVNRHEWWPSFPFPPSLPWKKIMASEEAVVRGRSVFWRWVIMAVCTIAEDIGQCGEAVSQSGGDSGVCSVWGGRAKRRRGAEVVGREEIIDRWARLHWAKEHTYWGSWEPSFPLSGKVFINMQKGKELNLNWYELTAGSICTHTYTDTIINVCIDIHASAF